MSISESSSVSCHRVENSVSRYRVNNTKLFCVRQVEEYKPTHGDTVSFVLLEKQTHITVFNTLSVSCERVVRVSAPKWLKSCGGSLMWK